MIDIELKANIKALADKAAYADDAFKAKNFAEAAMVLAQTGATLHYAEMQVAGDVAPVPAGGTD